MTTFDQILPKVSEVLRAHESDLAAIGEIVINRDLNGRVRLIVPEAVNGNAAARQTTQAIASELTSRLAAHAYSADRAVLFEEDMRAVRVGAPAFPLEGFDNVYVVDRLASETDWASIAPLSQAVPRIFFSRSRAVWDVQPR